MNRELLASIYGCLEHLNFSALPKLIKQKQVPDGTIPWSKFLVLLQNLGNCESMYYKHSYLSLKANNIQDQYIQVSNDLKNLLKPSSTTTTTTTTTSLNAAGQPIQSQSQQSQSLQHRPDDPEYSFISSLVLQTCIIVQVRIDMIGVYTTLVLSASQRQDVNLDMMINSLELIPTIYRDKITHPLLLGIKANTNYEISILRNLLKVYSFLARHVFKDTIFMLYQARIELESWKDFDQHNLSRTFDKPTGWQSNSIHQWLSLFYSALLAKATLYFHHPLRTVEEENGGSFASFKEVVVRNNPDYCSMIEAFVQKSNACFFGIFLECKGNPYTRTGYSFNSEDNIPSGLSAYPPIYFYPSDKQPTNYLPNIISILLENSSSMERPGDIFFYLDKQIYKADTTHQSSHHQGQTTPQKGNMSSSSLAALQQEYLSDYTYFLVRIDHQLFITVIYREIKKQKDSVINEFLKALVSNLRNTDLFNMLRTKRPE
ncbi:hypothetical protein SAMD00019534_059030 [Acytostelium subglobosum LB1]|uniref:hypothetical protein n=1 Tax=Acytostelium subglobosum LB1 TaxID=1410327 RepID=UPI0006451AC5|nr:hypothetical protein SAMD00019534_059030 [Acytostelium subglobosum LB1]GAM22728.1 hypothetical protein SAMD00019534_059030 [Acytostelium subglobosum LB1]|eukprot:XP_012753955.1 hypothetical protein SAMD00019534_059030 [Acytostelium subglobosum LB1]